MYLCLCWVCIAARRLSLIVARGATLSRGCLSFSWQWLLLLPSRAVGCLGSVAAALGLSCCMACGIFRDRGWSRHLHHKAERRGSPAGKFIPCYTRVIHVYTCVIPETPSILTYLCDSSWHICEASVTVSVLFTYKVLLNKTDYVHYRVLQSTDLYKCPRNHS